MLLFDLLPYIFLLFLTVVIPKTAMRNYTLVLGVIYVIFCGFRYAVGWDYFNYIFAIEEGGWYISRMEFVVRQIAYLANVLDNSRIFFILTSILTFYFFFKAISKLSLNAGVSIFVFLCLPSFFISTLTTVRFSLAVALLFYASVYINKNWFMYAVFFVLAVLSHKSAVIGIFALPFISGKINVNRFWNIIIFMVCFVFCQFYSFSSSVSVILSYIGGYLDGVTDIAEQGLSYLNNANASGFSKSPYMYAFINVFNLIFYNKLVRNDDVAKRYVTLYNLGCSIMFVLSFDQVFASRLAQPFMMYVMLLAPYYKLLRDWRYIVYATCVFVFFFQLSVKGNHADFQNRRNCYLPYKMSLE